MYANNSIFLANRQEISKGVGVSGGVPELQHLRSKMARPDEMHFFGDVSMIAMTLLWLFFIGSEIVAHGAKIAVTPGTSGVLFYHGPTLHCTSSALFSAA